jgi:hypothetical protein
MAVPVLVMGMRMFLFLAGLVVMFVLMGISLMGVFMLVHLPVVLVGVFMTEFGMSVLVLMGNTVHI